MGVRTKGRLDYGNGKLYVGELLDGKPDGTGAFYFPKGKYEGEFQNGRYHGKGTITYNPVNDPCFDNGEYDLSEKLIGRWLDNQMEGPFIHRIGGIAYDEVYRTNKMVLPELRYDLPSGETLRDVDSIKCWYGGQSAFIIETWEATFVFDWYRASVPPLNENKPVYIFVSHAHRDHFFPGIFSLRDKYQVSEIYMGYDRTDRETEGLLDSLSTEINDITSCFNGEQFLLTDFGCVKSLSSTDLGVAFLVQTKNRVFFHAGDLFCRSAMTYNMFKKRFRLNPDLIGKVDTESVMRKCFNDLESNESGFRKYIEPLRTAGVIDYAMLPLDPRWDDYGIRTVNHYLNTAQIQLFSPMHLWEQWHFVSDFVKDNPGAAKRMVSVNPDHCEIGKTIKLNEPYILRFSAR